MHASQAEKNTFGHDVRLHPVTRMPLEQGIGCLSDDAQALIHLQTIEAEQGKDAADKMRARLHAANDLHKAEVEVATADEPEIHHTPVPEVEEEAAHGHPDD